MPTLNVERPSFFGISILTDRKLCLKFSFLPAAKPFAHGCFGELEEPCRLVISVSLRKEKCRGLALMVRRIAGPDAAVEAVDF